MVILKFRTVTVKIRHTEISSRNERDPGKGVPRIVSGPSIHGSFSVYPVVPTGQRVVEEGENHCHEEGRRSLVEREDGTGVRTRVLGPDWLVSEGSLST